MSDNKPEVVVESPDLVPKIENEEDDSPDFTVGSEQPSPKVSTKVDTQKPNVNIDPIEDLKPSTSVTRS